MATESRMSSWWDHGYDQPPFPGAPPYAILSSETGYVKARGWTTSSDSITAERRPISTPTEIWTFSSPRASRAHSFS